MKNSLDGIVQIGEIINSHGVKGEMKVLPLTDDFGLFYQLPEVSVIDSKSRFNCKIDTARPFKRFMLIRLKGVSDIDAARGLMGSGIYVQEDVLRPLADDECFVHDLLDSDVYSTEDEYLGVVTDYFEVGEQAICEVTSGETAFMFPTSREILKEVIPPNKVIIQLVPGLRELNQK